MLGEIGAILLNFRCLSPKFEDLIPYVNESKSVRRVFGQDHLFCHRLGALNDGDILAP